MPNAAPRCYPQARAISSTLKAFKALGSLPRHSHSRLHPLRTRSRPQPFCHCTDDQELTNKLPQVVAPSRRQAIHNTTDSISLPTAFANAIYKALLEHRTRKGQNIRVIRALPNTLERSPHAWPGFPHFAQPTFVSSAKPSTLTSHCLSSPGPRSRLIHQRDRALPERMAARARL